MSALTAAEVTAVTTSVTAAFEAKLAQIDDRVEQLRRIKDEAPASSATENSVEEALSDATDYMSTLGVEVS